MYIYFINKELILKCYNNDLIKLFYLKNILVRLLSDFDEFMVLKA